MAGSASGNGSSKQVRAAGGIVTRPGDGGRVLVVHRPHYDDWSFPKGKRDPGETDEACALREVLEETGLTCTLGAELPSIEYVDRKGRAKVVRYWAMVVVAGPQSEAEFVPNDEVDVVRWVTPDEARELLTYPRDRELLEAVDRP